MAPPRSAAGRTRTFIAGLTCEALIAPWVIPGAMDRAAFDVRIETRLAPVLSPGTVVILDNLSVHRSPRAAQILKARGCWLLPVYSPDLNPIEINRGLSRTHGVRPLIFSKLKAQLRRIGATTFDAVITALGTVCRLFTQDECLNYFAHAGYVAD